MDGNSDFSAQITRLLKEGIDHYNFRLSAIKNIQLWESVPLKDVHVIIDEINDSGLALYTFLPFCYKFLGIDMFEYYLKIYNTNCDTKRKYIIEGFKDYPIEVDYSLSEFISDFNNFKNIGRNLIRQGATPVPKLKILGTSLWIDLQDI
jgi:hypothetical protein